MAAMSLDLSVVLIVLMVWALYFVLKKSFFDPINQILTTREAVSQGALEAARAQMALEGLLDVDRACALGDIARIGTGGRISP